MDRRLVPRPRDRYRPGAGQYQHLLAHQHLCHIGSRLLRGYALRRVAVFLPLPPEWRTSGTMWRSANTPSSWIPMVHWSEFNKGNHFAAMSAPELLLEECEISMRRPKQRTARTAVLCGGIAPANRQAEDNDRREHEQRHHPRAGISNRPRRSTAARQWVAWASWRVRAGEGVRVSGEVALGAPGERGSGYRTGRSGGERQVSPSAHPLATRSFEELELIEPNRC